MFKGYKYRIYPTSDQKSKIDQTINACRCVYNLALETKIYAYKHFGKSLSAFDLINQLVDLKKSNAWLKEVDSQSLQMAIKNIDKSFKGFFKGKGYPKFKSKYTKQSFQCPNNTRRVDFEKGLLTIPKISNIPIKISHRFDGKIKNITITRTATGKYFASVLVEQEITMPVKPQVKSDTTLGVDLGLSHFIITNKGEKVDNPRFLRNSIVRLKVLQRRASRKKKGSANRKKSNLKVAILHERIANQRQDFLHKLSHRLTHDSQVDTICVETLNVKGMVRNHKLAQAISDVSWSEFTRQLKYKCDWYGKNLIEIGTFEPSTKTCSCCGNVQDVLLSERIFNCSKCSVVIDRDVNAAINIKNFGLKQSGWGTSVEPVELLTLVGAMKQENTYGSISI